MTNEQFIMERVKWYEDQIKTMQRTIIAQHETIIDMSREIEYYRDKRSTEQQILDRERSTYRRIPA